MRVAQIIVAGALAAIIGVPFLMRPPAAREADEGPVLIVLTPHVQQIRHEFSLAFAAWHRERYGEPARIDWRQPGGTSEIMRLLQAKFNAAVEQGRVSIGGDGTIEIAPGTIGFDVMLGGGSYDHGQLKRGRGVTMTVGQGAAARVVPVPMSTPPQPPFDRATLDGWYGENRVGSSLLYDPEQYWLGTALSSFGIVYNRDVLGRLKLPEPRSFEDLCHPRLIGWVALSDPRQSGSVTTTYNSILDNEGWEEGWRLLREMAGNARYFTNSSTKPPIDVSQGEAAMGVAIDFYGRSQAQSVMRPGETAERARVGFTDPAGEVFIDADPVSIIRGGPNPELARRFVEFCLTDKAQSLWQFRAGQSADGLGPQRYELRRLPVRRVMYERHFDRFMDRVNPFEIASEVEGRGWRPLIAPVMGAMIDAHDELAEAWGVLTKARSTIGAPAAVVAEMKRLFYAMPGVTLGDGTRVELSPETAGRVLEAWRNPMLAARSRIEMTDELRRNFRQVVRLWKERRQGPAGVGGSVGDAEGGAAPGEPEPGEEDAQE